MAENRAISLAHALHPDRAGGPAAATFFFMTKETEWRAK